MVLKYYFDFASQPSRAVYIFLKENNIPFEPVPIALRKGEQFNEAFAKVNPWKKVPVLVDDGFVVTESIAMMRYLSQKFQLKEHWYPTLDPKALARVEEYLHWQHLNTRQCEAKLFFEKLIVPTSKKQPIDQKAVVRLRGDMEKVINNIESYYLRDKPFIAGDEVSVADLIGVCELMQLFAVCEEQVYEASPKVSAWMKRVRERLNPHFDDAHKITYRTRESFKKLAPSFGAKL